VAEKRRKLMYIKVFSWGMFVINYYQDETSQHYRPSQLRNPVCHSPTTQSRSRTCLTSAGKTTPDRRRRPWNTHRLVGVPPGLCHRTVLRQAQYSLLLPRHRCTAHISSPRQRDDSLRLLIHIRRSHCVHLPVRAPIGFVGYSWLLRAI
jgi:hypothetical protein